MSEQPDPAGSATHLTAAEAARRINQSTGQTLAESDIEAMCEHGALPGATPDPLANESQTVPQWQIPSSSVDELIQEFVAGRKRALLAATPWWKHKWAKITVVLGILAVIFAFTANLFGTLEDGLALYDRIRHTATAIPTDEIVLPAETSHGNTKDLPAADVTPTIALVVARNAPDPLITIKSHASDDKVGASGVISGEYRDLDPTSWNLFGIVEYSEDQMRAYGPFERSRPDGQWEFDVEFPASIDGKSEAVFRIWAVPSTRPINEKLGNSAKSGTLFSATSDITEDDLERFHTDSVKMTRSTVLVFVSDRRGSDDIYLIDVNGSGPEQVTQYPGDECDPAWSPDARQLIFGVDCEPGAITKIYTVTLDSLQTSPLITDTVLSLSHPSWSPDGQSIAYHPHSAGGNRGFEE